MFQNNMSKISFRFLRGQWVKQTIHGRGQEVGNTTVSLLLVGLSFHNENNWSGLWKPSVWKTRPRLNYMFSVVGSWWPDDARNQGISSHATDQVFLEYSGFSNRRINVNNRQTQPKLIQFNLSPPGQNGRHFTDDSWQMHYHEWDILYFDYNFTEVFVCRGSIDNKSSLVQVMAWHRTGDKPLPEPMQTQFTDIYAALG